MSTEPVQSADKNDTMSSHANFSFESLVHAYFDCRKHKRNTPSALAFEQNLERNLIALNEELADGSYRPGKSICFVVTRPKAREVWAADFRDRIVHHLLYNHIAPRFYASFIQDSCACIPGRGTLYAANRLEHKIRSATQNWSKSCFYLKCDLANFFVSIDKSILQPVSRGVDFVGQVIKPWHNTTRKRTVNVAIDRCKRINKDDFYTTTNSYFGLLGQANSSHNQRAKLAKIALLRGHSVNKELTKIYKIGSGANHAS